MATRVCDSKLLSEFPEGRLYLRYFFILLILNQMDGHIFWSYEVWQL
jgi:hypothetical protein